MTKRPRIRDYMASDLIVLSPQMQILQAMTVLLEQRISGAPVVDEDERLVGVLSKKDCLKVALRSAYFQEWGGLVDQFMSIDIETMDPDLDLVTAAERFLASPFRRFPVIEDGRLIGQISRADLLRALVENWR